MSKNEARKKYVELVNTLIGAPRSESQVEFPIQTNAPDQAQTQSKTAVPTLAELLSIRTTSSALNFQHISCSIDSDGVASVVLNRPNKGNAFNVRMWGELKAAMLQLSAHPDARVIILSGAGGSFSTGMDLQVFMELQSLSSSPSCEGRKREALLHFIAYLQSCVTSLEECSLPVIAAVSGHCIGGAIDLICAADLRYASKHAQFSIKEIDLAIVADMGTLQRLPKLIDPQRCTELALTARRFSGAEAAQYGLVLEAADSDELLTQRVRQVAQQIASKSPLAARGIKRAVLHARDHRVAESLQQVAQWNAATLHSSDLLEAATAVMHKREPVFKHS
jgi:enoyl-CoA hydratase